MLTASDVVCFRLRMFFVVFCCVLLWLMGAVRHGRTRNDNGPQALLGVQHVREVRCGEPVGAGHGLRLLLAQHAKTAEPALAGAYPLL